MGNQWGDINLCVPATKMLGDVSPPSTYNRRPKALVDIRHPVQSLGIHSEQKHVGPG